MSYKLFRSQDIKSALVSVFVSLFAVVLTVSAATTISSNINTGGTLTVSGASTLTGDVTASGALFVAGNEHITTDLFVYGGDINVGTGSATSTLTSASGFLGVGTTTPSKFFSVQGNGIFSGDLFSAGLTATGTVQFTGTAATTTLSGGLLVDTNSFMVDFSTNRVGVGTTSPRQLLGVQGNGLFSGDLSVAGLTATGTVQFTGSSVGVGTTTPGQEVAIVGDTLNSSAATTTVSIQTTSTTIGGCIQLRSVDNKNYRIYAAASTSNSGQLQVELGSCQ